MDTEKLAGLVGVDMGDSPHLAQAREAVQGLQEAATGPRAKEAARDRIAALLEDAGSLRALAALAQHDANTLEGAMLRVRGVHGLGDPVNRLSRAVARERARIYDPGQSGPRIAGDADALMDAPDGVPDGWTAPEGWAVGNGVWKLTGEEPTQVATRDVFVTRYLEDVDGGGFSLELLWRKVGGGYATTVIPGNVAANSQGLVKLAGLGLPVTSHNARDLAVFIDAALTANESRLPVKRIARRFGWVPGDGFLLGSEYVGPEHARTELASDPGLEQHAETYGSAGTWEGWLEEVVAPGASSPIFWLSVYNAVASVLIEPIGLGDNWALDRSGFTSTGKSTVGRAAFSVWGNPRHRPSWKTTTVAAEALAAQLRHLPISLDDSKKARSPQDVAGIIYSHSGGTGKLRGTPGVEGQAVGLRATARWASALDSDGEQALTSFTQDAGARARVLVLKGNPLSNGEIATRIGLGCEEHYGHLGRRALEWVSAPGNISRLRDQWAAMAPEFRNKARAADGDAVAVRLSRVVAALCLARLVCEEVGLPKPTCMQDPIDYAADAAGVGGGDADRPREAFALVYTEAVARSTFFFGRHVIEQDGTPKQPSGGWLGRWDKRDKWETLDVRPGWITELLERRGFDPGTIDRWVERGWIRTGTGKRNRRTRSVRLDQGFARLISFERQAIEKEILADD